MLTKQLPLLSSGRSSPCTELSLKMACSFSFHMRLLDIRSSKLKRSRVSLSKSRCLVPVRTASTQSTNWSFVPSMGMLKNFNICLSFAGENFAISLALTGISEMSPLKSLICSGSSNPFFLYKQGHVLLPAYQDLLLRTFPPGQFFFHRKVDGTSHLPFLLCW